MMYGKIETITHEIAAEYLKRNALCALFYYGKKVHK